MTTSLLDIVRAHRRRIQWDDDDAHVYYELTEHDMQCAIDGVVRWCINKIQEYDDLYCDHHIDYEPSISLIEYIQKQAKQG